MPRQTITLSVPNHAWLQDRVNSGAFKTQTEAVNDALRRIREIESGVDQIQRRPAPQWRVLIFPTLRQPT